MQTDHTNPGSIIIFDNKEKLSKTGIKSTKITEKNFTGELKPLKEISTTGC